MEELSLKRNGYDIKVRVHVLDPLTQKYRASAVYRGYEDRGISIHDDKNKELAIAGAVNKLLINSSPEILDAL
ncbi:hypothetical protein [Psychrobacillus sp. NPDC096389]|uniref:hypothetical protein n=1 Tax=Psychrobacillus sp. NPDC096389 TaxID=3364490 RepID=UPI0037F1688B